MAQPSAPVRIKVVESTAKVMKLDFAYTFRPVYYFSRIFGFLPFTIVYNANGSIQGPKVRVFDITWFMLSIALYILSAFMHFRSIENLKSQSFVLIVGDFLLLKLGLVFCILVIVMDMCNRFKLVEILKQFNSFDDKVSPRPKIEFTSANIYAINFFFFECRWPMWEFISIIKKNIDAIANAVQW